MSRRVVRIEIGARVLYDGESWTVAGLGADSVLLTAGARALRVAAGELVARAVLPDDPDAGPVRAAGTAVLALDALPAEQREQAAERARMLTLMRTGYPAGAPVEPGQQPDPRFAPGVPMRAREEAVGKAMGVSDRQVRKWAAAYDAYGPAGLADARLGQVRRPMGQCDPRVRDAILHVLDAQTYASKTNGVNTRLAVRDRLAQAHAEAVAKAEADGEPPPQEPALPAPSTFRKYLAELGRGRGRSQAAKQMRSIANRPDRAYGRFTAVRPFEVVLIDSSPVDLFCMDVTTGSWQQVVMTIALDLHTRSIAAWRFTPGDPDRTDACLLLHDMVTPKPLGADWHTSAAWRYSVPESVVVDPAEHPAAGLPFGRPDQVVVDHGKIFMSADFTEACRVLGITVQYARPYTPTDKAHVERVFRTVREQFWERLPGYKGPDVWSRGAKAMVEDQAFLFFHELEERFAEWVATGYQNTKHDGLELPSQPGVRLTPNEMFDHGLATAGFQRLVADPDLFVELLPTRWRTVQHYGVEIDGVRYNGPALDGFRNRKSPWGAQRGKWQFKADPRDRSTIYFWRPDDVDDPDSPGGWSIVRRAGANGHVPFTAAELAYAKHAVLEAGRNPRDPDDVAAAVDRIVARTRSLNPATAQERRLAATAIIRDHQARRDRGETVPRVWDPASPGADGTDGTDGAGGTGVPAGGAPGWAGEDRYLHDGPRPGQPWVPEQAGPAPARRNGAARPAGLGQLVDPADVPVLTTPEEVEYDPFSDPDGATGWGGYETVGDE